MSRPADHQPPSWSVEFDDWVNRTTAARDLDALLDFENAARRPGWPTRAPSTSLRCS